MTDKAVFMEHWVNIEPERMDRYETMYQWNPASGKFNEPGLLGEGQVAADFGCGPGFATIDEGNYLAISPQILVTAVAG